MRGRNLKLVRFFRIEVIITWMRANERFFSSMSPPVNF